MHGVRWRNKGEAMTGEQQRNTFAWLLAGLLLLLPCGGSSARPQNQTSSGGTKEGSGVISCPLDVVTIEFEVNGSRKREASSLGGGDFTVYENGVEQPIIFWAKSGNSGAEGEKAVYAIAYRPMIMKDGESHKIRVVARGASGRKLRVRLLTPKDYGAVRL